MTGLRDVTESLSARLHRSVTVDDAELRVLAYAIYEDQVDPMRTDAILRKATPPDSIEWLTELGIEQARSPLRLPGNASLGQLPRVCAPIRRHEQLFGYLWLIDADGSISDDELTVVERAAGALGEILERTARADDAIRERRISLGLQLLSDSPDRAQAAAADLAGLGVFTFAHAAAVAVARVQPEYRYPGAAAMDDALAHAAKLLAPGTGLWVRDGRDGVLISSCPLRSGAHRDLVAATNALVARLGETVAVDAAVSAGVGDPVGLPGELCRSVRQARQAALVATAVVQYGPVGVYCELGPYRLLSLLDSTAAGRDDLHPGVLTLLAPEHEQLLHTLEVYLDAGCDAPTTAGRLFIHRTTLYYRFDRMKDVAGIDFGDGEQRLALHMSIKAARLWGLVAATAPRSAAQ